MPMDKVLISLTTISTRVNNVHEVIDSILSQEVDGLFNFEVKLYLSNEQYMLDEGVTALPHELEKRLSDERFEVEFVENIGSYRKYLYAMKDHLSGKRPVDFLVTCDDDTLYPAWWLKTLYEKVSTYFIFYTH